VLPPAIAAAVAPLTPAEATKLGPLRGRYEALQQELRNIELLRQSLANSAAGLLREIGGSKEARQSAGLIDELSATRAAQREIDAEIDKALRELVKLKPK
jgi:hypothetical protein